MTDKISTIKNMGPTSDESFGRAGIHTAQQLRDLGPDEAYYRMLAAGGKPHFIGYYVMVMGLQGRPWNDAKGEEKKQLRQRFDAIKARAKDAAPSDEGLERALREIGIGPAKP